MDRRGQLIGVDPGILRKKFGQLTEAEEPLIKTHDRRTQSKKKKDRFDTGLGLEAALMVHEIKKDRQEKNARGLQTEPRRGGPTSGCQAIEKEQNAKKT
jgi:hypothetical protein